MRLFISRKLLSIPSLRLLACFTGLYNLNSGVGKRSARVLNISREVINTSDAVIYKSKAIVNPFAAHAGLFYGVMQPHFGVWKRQAGLRAGQNRLNRLPGPVNNPDL